MNGDPRKFTKVKVSKETQQQELSSVVSCSCVEELEVHLV